MLKYLFYPGVIFHELAHLISCFLLRVKVNKLKFGLEESYVKHEKTGTIKMALIALSPIFLGTFFSFMLIQIAKTSNSVLLHIILFYFVLSILYNCIPSNQDTKNIFDILEEEIKNDWKKTFFYKLWLIFKLFTIYLIIFIITNMAIVLDKLEIFRVIYIIIIFLLSYLI